MKMQLLDEFTLIIILSNEDLKEKSFDLNEMSSDKFQELFDKLLLLAKIELGFNIKNSNIKVEVLECSDGIVITIYKVREAYKKIQAVKSDHKDKEAKSKVFQKNSPLYTTLTYEFSDLELLFKSIMLLQELKSRKKINISQSDIFIMDKKYYLVLQTDKKNIRLNNAIISEYGKLIKANEKHRLIEYGKVLYKKTAIQDIFRVLED